MATSTYTFQTTFTALGGLQPDQQTPVGFPVFTDTRPTQVVQTELLLAAAGSAIALPIPASWTVVTQVALYNIDATGYVQVKVQGATLASPSSYVNPSYVVLPPNGGHLAQSFYIGTVAGVQYSNLAGWTVQAVDSTGVAASSSATRLYVYIAGY